MTSSSESHGTHAEDCQWNKTRLTLARRCTCGLVNTPTATQPEGLVERINDYLASPHEAPALSDRLHREAAAIITSLQAENERLTMDNDSLTTKVTSAQYAMDTVARFVRPRIPADQNPEQCTSFLAWIGMICRLEERGDKAEARATTLQARLDVAVEALTSCAAILPRYRMAGETTGDDEELSAVLETVQEIIDQEGGE